jgi:hypothetical protein
MVLTSSPHLGLKGSINNFPHFGGINPPFLDPDGQAMTEGKTYSFNEQNVPYLPFVIAWSTKEFSFDVSDSTKARLNPPPLNQC